MLIFTTVNHLSYWFRKKCRLQFVREASSPPKGGKVHALIPCTYLDTFVLDGRCNLGTNFVLDGTSLCTLQDCGDEKPRIIVERINENSLLAMRVVGIWESRVLWQFCVLSSGHSIVDRRLARRVSHKCHIYVHDKNEVYQ